MPQELAGGGDLYELLQTEGPLPGEEAEVAGRFVAPLLSALAYLHTKARRRCWGCCCWGCFLGWGAEGSRGVRRGGAEAAGGCSRSHHTPL